MQKRYETINRLEAVWRAALKVVQETDGLEGAIQFERHRWDMLCDAKEWVGLCLEPGCREKSERAYCDEHDEQKVR